MANGSKRTVILLVIALCLILVGDLLASCVQTDFGNVKIRDVRWAGSNGTVMSGLLYIPKTATAKTPAPGILAIHGYINSRETQDGFAIEFARRGYVVLAPDQTGHGYSDPPAFANGFGGIDGLKYLRSLDIVDPKNVGMEGHSMGGWAILVGAAVIPDGYKSFIFEGSSTETLGTPKGTATFPRNLELVYSQWDEFAGFMWGSATATGIVKTDKLKTLFGTTEDVVAGKLYGSIADGTARKLVQPRNTHPWDHMSMECIGAAVSWFQQTLQGGNNLPPENQTWFWKEIGNLIALAGMILLFFPVGALLLNTNFFKSLAGAPAESKPLKGVGWWIGSIIFIIVTGGTFLVFKEYPVQLKIPASAFLSENITTQMLSYAFMNGIVCALLFLLFHFVFNRKANANGDNYGLTWATKLDWGKIGKSFLLAALVAFAGYLTLAFSGWLWTVDYRWWIFAVKPMSSLQFMIFLCYLIPFILAWIGIATVLHGELRPLIKGKELSLGAEMLVNMLLLVLGFLGLFLFLYVPLFTTGMLGNPLEPLFAIVAIQYLFAMPIAAFILTYFYRKTGHIYPGVFLVAIFLTWQIVASQAIHFAF
jgi:pimeloyl-ACP methyl ester carboxylesterase